MTFLEKIKVNAFDNTLPYDRKNKEVRAAYKARDTELYEAFVSEFKAWLITEGIPERYASKVTSAAWSDGHSCGYSEVVNCSYKYIEIFE